MQDWTLDKHNETLIRLLPPSTRTAGFDAIIFGLRISQKMGQQLQADGKLCG